MDKRPHIPAQNKIDLPPKDGVLQAASDDGLGYTSWGGMDHGWHHELHSPVKNAVCKRWDTPIITHDDLGMPLLIGFEPFFLERGGKCGPGAAELDGARRQVLACPAVPSTHSGA